MSEKLYHKKIETPIGIMDAIATKTSICLLEFEDKKELNAEISVIEKNFNTKVCTQDNTSLLLLKKELDAYFKGELKKFTSKTVLIGTQFQIKVWEVLQKIPFGETRSYKEQSIDLGDVKAIRAVGTANGKNKLAILIPCHRVIGSDGSLTGYAGGLDRKRFLLNLEREIAGPKDLFSN